MEWQKNYNDLYRKFKVITNALRIAAKYARENVPEGKEYLEKWLYEAEQKVMTNKI